MLSGNSEDSPKARRWWTVGIWAVVTVLTLILAIQARNRQIHDLATARPLDINDFNRWLRMLPGFLHSHLAMRNDLWPMPPLTILLFSPFSLLSFPNAQFVWVLFKPLLLAVIFYCSLGIVRRAGGRVESLPLLLILLAWLWPVIGDMQEGQVNLLMLAPLAAGLYFAQSETAWGDLLAGGLIALATCIKVTPIIFLIYLLWRRRWRAAAALAIGVVFWLYLPLSLFVGWRQSFLWNQQYFHIMILPYVVHGAVQVPTGESIPSFLLRLLSRIPAFHTHHHGVTISYYVNVLNLSVPTSRLIIRLVLVGIGLGGLFWMRRRLPTLRCRRYVLEIGAIAAFMLWAEEWCWVPHYVTLIFTLMAAAMIATDQFSPRAAARRALAALAAAAFLMAMTSDVIKIFGPHAGNWGRTIDPALFAGILLVLAIMTTGYSHAAAIAPGQSVPQPPPQVAPPGRKVESPERS